MKIEPAGRRRGTPPPAVPSPGLVGEVGGQSGPRLSSHLALVQNPDKTSESGDRMNRPVEVS